MGTVSPIIEQKALKLKEIKPKEEFFLILIKNKQIYENNNNNSNNKHKEIMMVTLVTIHTMENFSDLCIYQRFKDEKCLGFGCLRIFV